MALTIFKYSILDLLQAYKENQPLITAYLKNQPIEGINGVVPNILGMTIALFLIALMAIPLLIWSIILFIKRQSQMSFTLKVIVGFLFLMFGLAPYGAIIPLIVIYATTSRPNVKM